MAQTDAQGRLHIHLHARSVLKYWNDEAWQKLTAESMLKADKDFEAELLEMARTKVNQDNTRNDGDDDSFDEALTVRRAMQNMELGVNRMTWTDRGYQRILAMAGENPRAQSSTFNLSFPRSTLR